MTYATTAADDARVTARANDSLSAVDAAFLRRETASNQMGNCGLVVVDCSTRTAPLHFDEVEAVLAQRLGLLPRLRQRLAWPDGAAGRPVWVDDASFALTNHVHRVILPAPGAVQQVIDTVEQVHWRLLDRSRPLWELYVVEGLERNRLGLLLRFHHALADGMSALYLAGTLLDDDYARRAARSDRTGAAPSSTHAGGDPTPDDAPRPADQADAASADRSGAASTDGPRTVFNAHDTWVGRVASWHRALQSLPSASSFRDGPFNRRVGPHRRVALATLPASELGPARRALRCSTSELVFSLIAGALGRLLTRRRQPFGPTLRALVPQADLAPTQRAGFGNLGSCVIVDLPVGPMSEAARARLVAGRLARVRRSDQRIVASTLAVMWEALPAAVDPLLVAVGERQRAYINLVVSYMRGSRRRLHFAGAAHEATYPVPPLANDLALTAAAVNLGGVIGFGFTGDWEAVGDIDHLAEGIHHTHDALRREVTG